MSSDRTPSAPDHRDRGILVHRLKTHRGPFVEVWNGRKMFEVRRADRDYRIGDLLDLQEYDEHQCRRHDEGRGVLAYVTSMVSPGEWGLPADVCVMGWATFSPYRERLLK